MRTSMLLRELAFRFLRFYEVSDFKVALARKVIDTIISYWGKNARKTRGR